MVSAKGRDGREQGWVLYIHSLSSQNTAQHQQRIPGYIRVGCTHDDQLARYEALDFIFDGRKLGAYADVPLEYNSNRKYKATGCEDEVRGVGQKRGTRLSDELRTVWPEKGAESPTAMNGVTGKRHIRPHIETTREQLSENTVRKPSPHTGGGQPLMGEGSHARSGCGSRTNASLTGRCAW